MLYAGGFAGVALGIARGTLEAFIELARDKVARGARNTMCNNNVIQAQTAQAEAKLRRRGAGCSARSRTSPRRPPSAAMSRSTSG